MVHLYSLLVELKSSTVQYYDFYPYFQKNKREVKILIFKIIDSSHWNETIIHKNAKLKNAIFLE